MNTKNFVLMGADPFRRKTDCTLHKIKNEQIQRLKDKPPILAKLLTLFFRGIYYAFEGFKYITFTVLTHLEKELHYLAFGK